jgi:thiol-disulfide isomerase/thioredoxin
MILNIKTLVTLVLFLLTYVVLKPTVKSAQEPKPKQQFLLFWRSDCGGCHTAIPQLVKKVAQLDTTAFTITAVSFDTDSISYSKAIKDLQMEQLVNQYNFKAGYRGNALAQKYNITKTPTLLYIDTQGNVMAEGNEAFKKLSNFKKE